MAKPPSPNDRVLIRLLDAWSASLRRLQAAHPARWRVSGLSDDEVRDTLLLALFEAARNDPQLCDRYDDALALLKAELSALRRRFRLPIVTMDLFDSIQRERGPNQEDALAELEEGRLLDRAAARAEGSLSRPQRQWLAAMKLAARSGGFFATSHTLNLASASRARGLHRSSAARAFSSLQAHFARELSRTK
jgi:hypothetical protein